ncbi:MAG: right-handed parallel beta-helix repeat-containing protein [Saprospiraceae bacterium]|nr:right-handed parallel beta-helix repeat-containing protein [Saprospiraceae bacterium]
MKQFYTSPARIALFFALFFCFLSGAFAATFTVTNLNDSGVGSLRQAIIDANASGPGPHTINFAVSGTIPINSSLPAIANSGITIDGGGTITINAQGGDINRDIFTINASNTTVKGFTVQNTGSQCFEVAGNLSNVTIQDIIANHTSNVMDNIVYVSGTSTNMTIKNVMCLAGMQDGFRAFHFQGGTQTNLLLEDITVNVQYQGIYFENTNVNNLDIINATIYGSYDHIYFAGGASYTANDVTIDGENTASLYSQRDGGGTAMIFCNYTKTNWQIKNITLDGDRANTVDDANYGIRFDNASNGITIDELLVKDLDIYSIWFNGTATNITINNTDVTTPTNGHGTTMQGIRFENTVTTLSMDNVLIDMDMGGTTDDADYGIVFAHGYQRTDVTLNDVTINEADGDGIYVDGPVTNFAISNSTITNNFDGIEFYNGYNHTGINFTNSSFTGNGRSGIFINTGGATNSGTISGNNISNNASHGLWFYTGNGNKPFTVSNNTISYNGGAGIYLNSGPDAINITQNSIFRNTGNGIELDGGGNLSYEGPIAQRELDQWIWVVVCGR